MLGASPRSAYHAMTEGFSDFDVVLRRRGRTWKWFVRTSEGHVAMQGREKSRAAAQYEAAKALFQLLLCAPYRLLRVNSSQNGGRDL